MEQNFKTIMKNMDTLTVNLEKKLLKENRRLAAPEELLKIKEYDKHTDLAENEILSRVGLNAAIKEGGNIKNQLSEKQKQTTRFNQDRVFHISQIESICHKYRLRFLNSRLYKGHIDSSLPVKISNFEVSYGLQCNSRNTYIVAPMRSFELEERPKDPLMFYQINDEYFYLIHKWGNDLNIFRRLLPLLSSVVWSFLIVSLIIPLPFLLIHGDTGLITYAIISGVIFFTIGIYNTFEGWDGDGGWDCPFRFLSINKWRSGVK